MKRCIACFAVAIIHLMSSPVFGATLTSVEGPSRSVQANQGGGFANVAAGTQVRPGDRILVRDGGRTRITFENGCTLVLDQPGVYDVPSDPNCQAGGITPTQTMAIVGVGVAVGIGIAISKNSKPSSP